MNADGTILLDRDGQVATITINNPHRANTLSRHMLTDIGRAIDEIDVEDDIRAAILTGAGGRTFIGGADIRDLSHLTAPTARTDAHFLPATIEKIGRLEKPVVAAVNGPCLGAGLELAIGCDMVLASENAVFGMPEIEIGVPSIVEAALLPNLTGALRTKEFLLTGDRWDAVTAERYGLVN